MGATDRDRLAGLLTFGSEILAAKEKITFAMADYQAGGVFREELIGRLPGIDLGAAEDGSWLRVGRLRETDPPAAPELFDGWIANRTNNPDQVPILSESRVLGDQDLILTPFDGFSHEDILQLAANRLGPRGRLVSRQEIADGASIEPANDMLSIYGFWALYTRPRSESYRRDDLRKMAAAVVRTESDDALPAALRGFVHESQDVEPATNDEFDLTGRTLGGGAEHGARRVWPTRETREIDSSARPGRSGEYFFPLPYNEDQAKIIDRLEQDGAVVVTGPPGTGKSHTIANVIAHYMATGKRVLVTAKTAEAIAVVRKSCRRSCSPWRSPSFIRIVKGPGSCRKPCRP